MKVVYTEEALKDLDTIADWLIVIRRLHRSLSGASGVSSHTSRAGRKVRAVRRRAPVFTQCRLVVIHTRFSIASRMVRCRYSTSITPHSNLGMSKRSPTETNGSAQSAAR